MLENVSENNKVTMIGKVVSGFTFSHELYGEKFYTLDIEVSRLSEQADLIPLLLSERLIDVTQDYLGRTIVANGQFRSYNRHEATRNRLVLSVFVRDYSFVESFDDYTKTNQVYLDGFVCKAPIYRKTPLGREIADLLLAVNRPYGKSDYIPCIAWGRNARYAAGFAVGERICIQGRVQSREYSKRTDGDQVERRIAYEVSISKVERPAAEEAEEKKTADLAVSEIKENE